MSTPKFEIYKAKDGWRFRFKGANGEIITGGESYMTKWGAKRGVNRLIKLMANAPIIHVEK